MDIIVPDKVILTYLKIISNDVRMDIIVSILTKTAGVPWVYAQTVQYSGRGEENFESDHFLLSVSDAFDDEWASWDYAILSVVASVRRDAQFALSSHRMPPVGLHPHSLSLLLGYVVHSGGQYENMDHYLACKLIYVPYACVLHRLIAFFAHFLNS